MQGNLQRLPCRLCSILVLAAPVGTQWYQEAINSCSYVLNTKFTHTQKWHDIYSFHSLSLYQIVSNVTCFVNIMLSRKFTTFFSPVERCCILILINDTSSFFPLTNIAVMKETQQRIHAPKCLCSISFEQVFCEI